VRVRVCGTLSLAVVVSCCVLAMSQPCVPASSVPQPRVFTLCHSHVPHSHVPATCLSHVLSSALCLSPVRVPVQPLKACELLQCVPTRPVSQSPTSTWQQLCSRTLGPARGKPVAVSCARVLVAFMPRNESHLSCCVRTQMSTAVASVVPRWEV
jgi:hypothetical protein